MIVRIGSVFLLLFISNVHMIIGARILGLFPIPGKSHMAVNSALVMELARRGHQVTVLSPFPEKNPPANYHDVPIDPTIVHNLMANSGLGSSDPFKMNDLNFYQLFFMMWNMGNFICEASLQDPLVQKVIHSKDLEFDLIITEAFFNDCFLGFVHKLKIPVIQVCSFGGTSWMGDWVGNPNPYSYVPNGVYGTKDRMTFWERVENTFAGIYENLGRRYYYLPKQDSIMRKYFNYTQDMPSITELETSTALVLLNHHFSISHPRPFMPNMVQVGGMHIKPPNKLPQDLQNFIDGAKHGVIFFSMGSYLQSSQMPETKVKALLDAFSKMKQLVLWKWETDTLPGQPSNVKLGKWLPQSDILAHPNVKLFITHGGLLSTLETINRGVPIVGIPVYGDQTMNMRQNVAAGLGVMIQFDNVSTESVSWAVNEVLENPRYYENAQRLSRVFRDQPLTPLEQAVFWTEYVIRHKGAPHMRSAALDLTWYQYFLLDVIAVLTLVAAFVVLAVFLLFRLVTKKLFRRNKSNKIVQNSQKKRD